MRLFLFGDSDSPFVHDLALWLRRRGDANLTIDGLALRAGPQRYRESVYDTLILPPAHPLVRRLARLPKIGLLVMMAGMRRIAVRQPVYDICHIHYVAPLYGLCLALLGVRYRALVLSFWGSDYYRTSRWGQRLQAALIRRADRITFANEATRDAFRERFGTDPAKLAIARFGLSPLEAIDALPLSQAECKQRLGLSPDAVVVACGYNASPYQQHLPLITVLERCASRLPSGTVFLFFLSYGGPRDYRDAVVARLADSPLTSLCLTEYRDAPAVATLRKATDIMIHLPVSDQFSGSMQEHLYAGSRVITGSWLPYSPWIDRGMIVDTVDTLDAAGDALIAALGDPSDPAPRRRANRTLIADLSSWSRCIDDWKNVYTAALAAKETP